MNTPPIALDARTVLDLQKTIGNQHVVTLLKRRSQRSAEEPLIAPAVDVPIIAPAPAEVLPLAIQRPHRLDRVLAIVVGVLAAVGAYLAVHRLFPMLTISVAVGASIVTGMAAWYFARIVPQVAFNRTFKRVDQA